MKTKPLRSIGATSRRPIARPSRFIHQRLRQRIAASWILPLLLLTVLDVVQAQFTFTTNNGAISITKYTGSGGVVIIPSATNGYPVTGIGVGAFANAASVSSVIIPSSVTNIGSYTFNSCSSLTNVTIPNSVTSIGGAAFEYCGSLKSATIPNSVTSIGNSAFYSAGLESVRLPDSITSLPNYTFQYCASLTNVTVPNSVTNIGNLAFQGCTRLTSVTIGNGVTSIGADAFSLCTGLTNVTIPGSVTSIGVHAFGGCASLNSAYFTGNAPTDSTTVFAGAPTTVYYLPGTAGWGPTLGDSPTMLWNPQVQTGGASFGVQNNQFGFNITGTTNIPIVVAACTNLASPFWTPLQTLTLTNGLVYFIDPQWTNYPARLYRLRSP